MQFPTLSESFCSTDISALRDLGHSVDVFSFRRASTNEREILASRGQGELRVDSATTVGTLSGLMVGIFQPRFSLYLIAQAFKGGRGVASKLKGLAVIPRAHEIAEKIRASNYDVVHLFWGHYPSVLGLLLKRKEPLRIVTQFLGAYDLELMLPLSRCMSEMADWIFTHAEANLPKLKELGVDLNKVDVVYRGARIMSDEGTEARNPFQIVTVSRLVEEKGVDDAIRALAKIRLQFPEARLNVVGDGPDMARLKALVEELGVADTVKFTGPVSHSEVYSYLRQASIFMLLSRAAYDRLPNVIKEAMSVGTVVVSTKTTGIEELIPDERTGSVVATGDLDGVVSVVCRLWRNPDEMAEISARGRDRILKEFDVNRTMAKYVERWSGLGRPRS
jgi:glycosyltransferase involved in cell wall biosynthesis